ncbi:Multiple epidermal growth factor-like domains protein 8 [Desmophyllum pertusum]|uniref:Multiple epidermal growth factor-like domains protein 8 n=1 Tax=Desmophyllum pertusum TaxID=174260 RepID=A0A9W9ZKT2_9CNID|nr:Multiple epidermal growth factor-like domains protein 8 [Desmophyllum pertusum]
MADAPVANISVDNGSVVTVNASVFCGRQGGCNNCTSHEFCLWCEGKQTCQVYYNASTTEQSCSKNESAYKDQCIYPIGVIPCIERKNCKACAQEDWLCYWCPSTAKCFRYASHNSQPADCAGDKWYVQDCPTGGGIGLMWVLIPILAIILIPIIIYIIIWLVCCCMRAAGYEPLEPAESAKKKHPKGIRLRAGSPQTRLTN